MTDDRPAEVEAGVAADRAEAIRRSDAIRIQVFTLLLDFDPPEPKCALDPVLIRARDMFVPNAKQMLQEMSVFDQVNAEHTAARAANAADSTDRPVTREAEEEEPRAEDDTSAAGASETSETALETRPPPPPTCKRPRERSPAPPFAPWAFPMILSHVHIMATPPVELVGRIVRLWRPDLELLSGHAYARVVAYEPELDLHMLAWLFDETVREEVCFRAMDPHAAQLVVQRPTAAFMVSLKRHQCKKQRL